MKRFTSVILIFAFTVPSFAPVVNAAWECKYSWKLTECVDANKNGSARSIEDFICKETSDQEQMLLQIILDDKFKEIDEEAEAYLEQLEQSKEEYFWDEPTKNFLSAIDDINKNFAQYE